MASRPRLSRPSSSKLQALATAESTLHCIEVLGCVFSTVSAVAHREAALAAWSLSALATSLAALWLLHGRKEWYPALRTWLYAGMRLHRAFAIVAMRRVLRPPMLSVAPGRADGSVGDRIYFAKAVLVNSSILPILLQALVLQLPLALQAAVQVAVASVVVQAMPAYCASLEADGVRQAQWAWLSRLQGALSSVVMAATSSSRGAAADDQVPCSVVLSYLVLVFEVIVPVLFVFFFDRAAAAWFGGGEGGSPAAGTPARHLAATWSPNRDRSPEGPEGGAGSGAAGAGAAAAAAAERPRQQGRGGRGGAAPASPSAWLVLLFGLGLAGVLWDVALTYTARMVQK